MSLKVCLEKASVLQRWDFPAKCVNSEDSSLSLPYVGIYKNSYR